MIELVLAALASLSIALYAQARLAARAIRRNRLRRKSHPERNLILCGPARRDRRNRRGTPTGLAR